MYVFVCTIEDHSLSFCNNHRCWRALPNVPTRCFGWSVFLYCLRSTIERNDYQKKWRMRVAFRASLQLECFHDVRTAQRNGKVYIVEGSVFLPVLWTYRFLTLFISGILCRACYCWDIKLSASFLFYDEYFRIKPTDFCWSIHLLFYLLVLWSTARFVHLPLVWTQGENINQQFITKAQNYNEPWVTPSLLRLS